MDFPHLFTPGNIGTLQLPNRILMGSMHLGYEGVPGGTERMAEFYAARARGGAALIITGGCAINEEAIGGAQFSCIFRDEDLAALAFVVNRVHEERGKIGLQLFHAGRYATREWLFGLQPVAPSAIRSSLHPTTPREMSEQDIWKTINDFAAAAQKAMELGFDCVEIMGSEGYLINQFFSPLTNRRQDDWGGLLKNRMRFSIEVLNMIRKFCGSEFPVIYRVSGLDLMPGSSTWDETFEWFKELEAAGSDAFNIGIGWHESRIPTISMLVPRAYYSFVSERIRKHVKIPCIASNRINDPRVAEQVLAEGKADFVSMARALLADSEFPNKARSQDSSSINTCIACNQACLDNAFRNQPTTCILNPQAGREMEMTLKPAEFRKKVVVVGAGPAGLEACRVLALRGHHVTLFEKRDKIGGQLLYAIQIPGKQEFLNTIRYYKNALEELNVHVQLGVSVSPQELKSYDAVIFATGAKPFIAPVEGHDLRICIDYETFFNGTAEVGSDVVIIGAGGIGCDIAHLLSDSADSYPAPSFFNDPNNVALYEEHIRSLPRSHNIAITRRGKRIGERLGPTTRWALMQLLENRGVQMMTQVAYDRITSEGLYLKTRSGKSVFLPAKTIVFATGQSPESTLYNETRSNVEFCHAVGSCHTASESNAQTAIWEAFEIARRI
ncbi:MAG TPA: FAD-dependent oxidoreductase [Acidobacteriota bacterium]|nr:FAD-dependent oxidoreductase [Acidobacteriota bacterium]